ncbi:MAG: hypothetical protein Q4D76_03625 [Oscillospiraceae bacterium]|nr:hypothetical protein [Oscillospiraceae bacterium]
MKRRRSRKIDIAIDLTSLLDVIFILLLVLMISHNNDYNARIEANQKIVDEAELTIDVYNDIIDTLDNIGNSVYTISLTARFDENQIHNRTIAILCPNENLKEIEMIGANVDNPISELTNYLESYIEKYSDIPVILSLNPDEDKILYRDHLALKKVVDELSGKYENVFVKRVNANNIDEVSE